MERGKRIYAIVAVIDFSMMRFFAIARELKEP